MAPPSVRFVTPVYHPNIDSGAFLVALPLPSSPPPSPAGRICLDILNVGDKGKWTPSLSISCGASWRVGLWYGRVAHLGAPQCC